MLRNSIIALSAAALLGATALAPAEAVAHGGGGGGGSHNVTAYRPIVNPVVSAGLGLGSGNNFGTHPVLHPIPHPIPFPCKVCVIGFPPPHGPPPPPPTTTMNPGHGGFTASFGGGDYGAYSTDYCQVVRKRTPSGQIIEVCDNWLGQ
jgi:hypothetical protein